MDRSHTSAEEAMKKRRILISLLIGLGVVIVSCVIAIIISNSARYKAEQTISDHYGVVSSASVLSDYFDQHVILGQTKDEVFAFFRKGNPNAIRPIGTLNDVSKVSGASCYRVRYDDLLNGTFLLNRFICFDGDDKLILIQYELYF
jgi:hypothetical protein